MQSKNHISEQQQIQKAYLEINSGVVIDLLELALKKIQHSIPCFDSPPSYSTQTPELGGLTGIQREAVSEENLGLTFIGLFSSLVFHPLFPSSSLNCYGEISFISRGTICASLLQF